jgi:putative PEP-CTERM system TPR-repeat lipoprotein
MMRKSFVWSVIAALTLLAACGNDSASLLRTVQTLEAKGDYKVAITELTSGLRADPQSGVLHYHRGRIYNLVFDGPSAEHDFRRAGESGVIEGGRVALGLGRALYHQRKYQEITAHVVPAQAFEQGILASVHTLRGHALMCLDRIDAAKRELEAAASIDPTNADVVLLQARFKAAARDVKGALQLVGNLLAQDPNSVDALIHQANLLTVLGRSREAIVSFSKAIAIQPRHLHALMGRANVLVQMGRLVDAQKDVDALRAAYPRHPASAYLRGQIHYWRGEYREALDVALRALKIDQADGPARLLSGMANLMLDAPVQAEHEFARYMTQQSHDVFVRRVLMDLRTDISQKRSEAKAFASSHADELRKASVQALFDDAYIRVWQHSKVADWFERVAALSPPDPLIAVKQARLRFARELLDLAASDLERTVALNDQLQASDAALVLVQLARGDLTKAMDAVSMMVKKSPDSPDAATLAGIVLVERNQLDEAERRFDEALQRDPNLIGALVNRVRMDVAAGRSDRARKRFEDALRLDPDNLQVLVVYANFEVTVGKRSEAHKLLNQAVKAHPKAPEPKAVLIDLLKRENDKTRATAVAAEMLAAHPKDPAALELAADIQLWNGDQDRGLATLQQLVTVLPRSPESYFKLARAQFKAGLRAEADANLQKALTLPIDDPENQGLPLSGLIDDSKTLAAIESARKSFKPRPNPSVQLEGQL